MLTTSAAAASMLTGTAFEVHCRVTSWRDGVPLAEVPVEAATETVDRSLAVPEMIRLTVPRVDNDGYVWDPAGDAAHPLGHYGQRLVAEVGIGVPGAGVEWLSRGEYLIQDTAVDGDVVTVTATGLLQLLAEARFVAPFQPAAAATVHTVIRSLVEPALTVDLTAAPASSQTIGASGTVWDSDRLAALGECLDAIGAEAAVRDGVLVVTAATDPTVAVLALTDGAGGTVVSWAGSGSRDGLYNLVVAQGESSTGAPLQAQVPVPGPVFNPLPVPYTHYSPLLTTAAACTAAANTVRRRLAGRGPGTVTATAVPDPRLQDGDCVAVTGAGLIEALGVVEQLVLPWTAGAGEMTVGVRVL